MLTLAIVPPIQQVVFYIGYDSKYLYIAMRSPHKEGTYPQARVKQRDDSMIVMEDHAEIQILKHPRNLATRPGFGFYKMMVNARGAMEDIWWYNGTVGTENLWSTGGVTKCTVTPTYWDMEMSIEIAQMGEKSLDLKQWVMQLVRTDSCIGYYFAGWVPGTWLEWNRFPQVTFDPSAPAFQLLDLGDIMNGNPGVKVAVNGNDAQPHNALVSVQVLNKAGKELYSESKPASVPARGRVELSFAKSGLPIDDAGNVLVVNATEGEKTLYNVRMNVNKLTEEYRTKSLDPWLKGRPQSGDWEYGFAYLPYSNVARCYVDLDFFGVPASISKAQKFTVGVYPKGGTKPLATGTGSIKNLSGTTMIKTPELKEGQYIARFTLVRDGKEVAKKDVAFPRKHFPWERNKLGISDEVIPPYTPIVTRQETGKSPTLSFWARTYTIGGNGLPESISVGNSQLLRSPARFDIVSNGKLLDSTPGKIEVTGAKPSAVDLKAQQLYGPVNAEVKAHAEYDGWYEVALTLSSTKPTSVDNVDLVLDLGSWADTLYAHRGGDGRVGNKFGAVPPGNGVVWQSTELASYGDYWKSFVPTTFLGSGSKGIWLYAWSSNGWVMKDNDACVRVERDATGQVSLRVRFLSGRTAINKPRTIKFALLVSPTKPKPINYRNFQMSHDTVGFRYYGDSVDSYALHTDRDFDMFRKMLLYGAQTELAEKIYGTWHLGGRGNAIINGQPIVMYGSTYMTGTGMEEFDTFAGEWLGKTNWTPASLYEFNGQCNYSGSVVWDTPKKIGVCGMNFTQSQIDCFIWYNKKLMEKGMNGTWWDNASLTTIYDYDPETGQMELTWNTRSRRDLMKRLNTIGWELMRAPCWIQNMHDDFSFNQVMWPVENDWYIPGEGMDYLDHMSIDEFRAMACTKSMQLVTKPWLSGGETQDPEVNRHVQRSKVGMMLLHDIQNFGMDEQLRRYLNFYVDYDRADRCWFLGYWEVDKGMLNTGNEAVKASVYANATRKSAAILLLNTGASDVDGAGLTIASSLVAGSAPRRMIDADTGEELSINTSNAGCVLKSPLTIKKHDYRMLIVSCE